MAASAPAPTVTRRPAAAAAPSPNPYRGNLPSRPTPRLLDRPRSEALLSAAVRHAVALPFLLVLSGCAALARPATRGFADDLSASILNQTDAETVRDGAPAYLLAIDALIEGDPNDPGLLLTGARLYGAYASAFVEDEARARMQWDRTLGYARRALCIELPQTCDAVDGPFEEFTASLAAVGRSDVPTLYGFGTAWVGWVQMHSDDWRAVAQVPKIEALMRRVLQLDEPVDRGGAHLVLGVLLSQRPARLGGRPELGRKHFERAVELSEDENLMAKVLFARHYARLVFDRELHDRLLLEVSAADPEAPGLTLSNTLAREQARRLLEEADDYF